MDRAQYAELRCDGLIGVGRRRSIGRLIDPPVRVLIRDGRVDDRNLRRCGLTAADLDAVLRQHGCPSPDTVALAIFETKGAISVLR
jgi:uncharacterized membrane protein YcaP (DUF421 family)